MADIVCNYAFMREAQYTLENLLEALKYFNEGDCSFSAACRKYGIDWYMARNLLRTTSFQKLRMSGKELELPPENDAYGTGYERLYADVFCVPMGEIGNFVLPPDAEETINYVLDGLSVNERHKDVVIRYYGLNGHDEETYDDIGKTYCLTRERIRQVHKRMLRLLRYPPRARLLKMGVAKYKEIEATNELAKQTYEQLLAAFRDEAVKNAQQNAQETFDRERQVESVSIDYLDLSVRSRNCLVRAGIKTIGELIRMSDYELSSIRNLGNGSVAEIREKIRIYVATRGVAV